MATANLIIAAGYRMKEQARQEMAEEDLGGGIFDQDVKEMRDFAAKVPLPQVYDADEQQVLNEQLALHDAPQPSLRKYKTGTKLYTCQITDTGSGVDVRAEMEVHAPVEQVRMQQGGLWRAASNLFYLARIHRSSGTGWGTRPNGTITSQPTDSRLSWASAARTTAGLRRGRSRCLHPSTTARP
jgi:hypothetical protein